MYVSFDDNRPLSPTELSRIRRHIEELREVIEQRSGTDCPAFLLPGGNWAEGTTNDFRNVVRYVAEGTSETLNRLLYYTNVITGVKPVFWSTQTVGVPSLAPIPPDHKPRGEENIRRPAWHGDLVRAYEALWKVAPELRDIRFPSLMGHIGLCHEGHILNPVAYRYYLQLAWLRRAAALPSEGIVLEIGSSYGALGYLITRLLPKVAYVAIDLPEMMIFSASYLEGVGAGPAIVTDPARIERTLRESSVTLCPAHFAPALFAALPRIDTALNFASFGEMSEAQVDYYASAVAERLDGTLYEANDSGRQHIACDVESVLKHYLAGPFSPPETGLWECDGTHRLWRRQS